MSIDYYSKYYMELDSLKGLTSVASRVTNHRGIVLFPDLDTTTYCINSQVVIGKDTLTGMGKIEFNEKNSSQIL